MIEWLFIPSYIVMGVAVSALTLRDHYLSEVSALQYIGLSLIAIFWPIAVVIAWITAAIAITHTMSGGK